MGRSPGYLEKGDPVFLFFGHDWQAESRGKERGFEFLDGLA
jgi:hypothetical protein